MHCLLPGNGTENAARCIGPRSTLHEPSQRAASAIAPHSHSLASSDEGKQQSTGAIRPPRRTNSRPHSTPKQGAPAEALHQLIQRQEPRCLIRSTAVFYFKKAVLSSATARLPHRHPAFGTSMELSSTHILPHSPSGRSTVPNPKCRFCNQSTKSSAGRASPLSHSTRNQGLSRSGLLYSRGLPFSAFLTALPAARATASPAAVSHSIVGA